MIANLVDIGIRLPELVQNLDPLGQNCERRQPFELDAWGAQHSMNWKDRRVLVSGGASFIGSHLVDSLVSRGAHVTVADDLSSGKLSNLQPNLESDRIRFMQVDLRVQADAERAVSGQDSVFHLAADHGGRGYIETHESACAGNLLLDGIVFKACAELGVQRIVYASSGCVYPRELQADANNVIRLTENQVGPPYDADGIYGWAKLMGEKALAAYAKDHGIKAVSCRYFTAYGPRATREPCGHRDDRAGICSTGAV